MLKRIFDVVFSSLALIPVLPLCAILYPVVKLDSRGPFFFGQRRMGLHGKPFRIWKIRTMYEGAERETGVTCNNDARVTRVGRLLRRTKIDELPQFINVWLGQMSIVGPRPELPRYRNVHPELWEKILSIRPGITDSAALIFFDEETRIPDDGTADEYYRREVLPKKQRLYVDYLGKRSFFYDLKIIAKTLRLVFMR